MPLDLHNGHRDTIQMHQHTLGKSSLMLPMNYLLGQEDTREGELVEELQYTRPEKKLLKLFENSHSDMWIIASDQLDPISVTKEFLLDPTSDNYLRYNYSDGSLRGIIVYGDYIIQVEYFPKSYLFVLSNSITKQMQVICSN